jgi:DNA-binding CsgD family transcriptional regulator
MHLSTKKSRILSRVIGLLSADHADGRDLRTAVGGSLLDLLDADFYASYVWNPQKRVFELGVALNMDNASIQNYESYFQHRHIEGKSRWLRRGVNPVSAFISHRDLMRTEIYNDFLRPSGHYYGINLFAFDGRDSIGDIRIWRRNGRSDFDRDEVNLLGLIEPGFTQALKRVAHFSGSMQPAVALMKLSPRETAVAELAAKGLADKEIARRLNVTFATVRTHLDNAFAKLGVRNRTQLAALLFAKPVGSNVGAPGRTTH